MDTHDFLDEELNHQMVKEVVESLKFIQRNLRTESYGNLASDPYGLGYPSGVPGEIYLRDINVYNSWDFKTAGPMRSVTMDIWIRRYADGSKRISRLKVDSSIQLPWEDITKTIEHMFPLPPRMAPRDFSWSALWARWASTDRQRLQAKARCKDQLKINSGFRVLLEALDRLLVENKVEHWRMQTKMNKNGTNTVWYTVSDPYTFS